MEGTIPEVTSSLSVAQLAAQIAAQIAESAIQDIAAAIAGGRTSRTPAGVAPT